VDMAHVQPAPYARPGRSGGMSRQSVSLCLGTGSDHRSTTSASAAVASVAVLVRCVDDQAVVEKKFFADRDVAQRVHRHDAAAPILGVFFPCNAVRLARMVDVPCGVATIRSVDHL